MELNINSPSYFTKQYGVIDEIYSMCRGISKHVENKQYSDLVDIVGITPIIAPKDIIANICSCSKSCCKFCEEFVRAWKEHK